MVNLLVNQMLSINIHQPIWFQFHQKFTISHTCCLLSDCWCSGNLNNKHLHIRSPTHFVASDSLSLQTKPKPAERGTTLASFPTTGVSCLWPGRQALSFLTSWPSLNSTSVGRPKMEPGGHESWVTLLTCVFFGVVFFVWRTVLFLWQSFPKLL